MEKGKIQFKPLHEGMGFHPFSDGLPYAPESKAGVRPSKGQSMGQGSGAVSAGRPRFATATPPTKTARQLQTPLAVAPTATIPASGFPAPQRARVAPVSAPAPGKAGVEESRRVTDTGESVLRKRFFAYLLDTVVHAAFWIATNLVALFWFQFQIDGEILRDSLPQFLVFFAISQWIFIGLQEVLFQNSIGKSFFDLEFKRNHGSLFLRSFVFMLGVACFGLGLFFRPQDRFGEPQLKQRIES
jgi:hypothetical protein